MNRRTVQRLLAVASGAVAIAVGNASLASAHHCYKESWADAAYAAQPEQHRLGVAERHGEDVPRGTG